MAALKINRLRELVIRSYEEGYKGCLDCKEEFADEIIKQLLSDIGKNVVDSDWKVYTVEELRKQPLGTLVEHSRFGKGWIDGTDKSKSMTFETGQTLLMAQNDEPWTEPLRILGTL